MPLGIDSYATPTQCLLTFLVRSGTFISLDLGEVMMASALDVAQYILDQQGPMTTMKMQKLVYYCQAWSLVWDGKPIFSEDIQAWASGPVVRELYQAHKGAFLIDRLQGANVENLSTEARETTDAVLRAYGDKSPQWLIDLTHKETPWNEARQGLPDGQNSENEITLASMSKYYDSLLPSQ